MKQINFQKTLIYNNSALPPREKIKEICEQLINVFLITKNDDTKTWYIICSEFLAYDLINVVIQILKKFPYKEYPFEEDITDMEMEAGERLEDPEDLN